MGEALQQTVNSHAASEKEIRDLCGGGTHQGAVWTVLDRVDTRTVGWLARCGSASTPAREVATAGAGINLCGYQTIAWWLARSAPEDGIAPKIMWVAEAEEAAIKAGRALDDLMAQRPRRFQRAEGDELRTTRLRATVEWVTLNCSAYSLANAEFPSGVDASLAEMESVLRGTAVRGPPICIVETSAGLWRRPLWLRRRYEGIVHHTLRAQYHVESMLVSPSRHAAAHQDRERVFYVCVSRSLPGVESHL